MYFGGGGGVRLLLQKPGQRAPLQNFLRMCIRAAQLENHGLQLPELDRSRFREGGGGRGGEDVRWSLIE